MRRILKQYWGYDDFRGIQSEIIQSVMSGHDTLGLMPTGGGKSITFQVPALAKDGVCIVVTPLIALMKDQVQNLKRRNIRAEAVYSGMDHQEVIRVLENAIFGAVKLLYVSPERLSSDLFLKKVRHMKVSFITIDEAHCISQWGYDFRPSYRKIADLRNIIGKEIPVLALTATATPKVIEDIQLSLHFRDAGLAPDGKHYQQVFRMSFERTNLTYKVKQTEDKEQELIDILNATTGSSIVYVRSRRRARETAELLVHEGITATFYHAGLDGVVKDDRQTRWQNDEFRVMVATNAFGMGIDKPDVRHVIHIDTPDSIEAYFQEAGRGGRDGEHSEAILLYNGSDTVKLKKRIAETFPSKDYLRTVYEQLGSYYQIGIGGGADRTMEFNIDKFCFNFHHFPIVVNSALKLLERAGYIDYDDVGDCAARVHFLVDRDSLYTLRSQSDFDQQLIEKMLRLYSGMFSDYAYIDDALIAQELGCNRHKVYLALKSLADRKIISFVPRRLMPTITFIMRREETEQLAFPRSIYEDRRDQYARRIDAMINYGTNNKVCRSRQLLSYFGQNKSKDCHQCDVCLDTDAKGIIMDED